MRTSLEWAEEMRRRAWIKCSKYEFSSMANALESVAPEVIREAVNEATGEVIKAMRQVENLTPGYVQHMMEAPDGSSRSQENPS